jgi:antirestriction protein ArdC
MTIYETVTQRILHQLAAGLILPWRDTWKPGLPKSLVTGREYRDHNLLVLASTGYTSRYWLTFHEAQQYGGLVRTGERPTSIIDWHWRTPEELVHRAQATGKNDVAPCGPLVLAVFNLEQVEGIARPADDLSGHKDRLRVADQMLATMPDPPQIVHALTVEPAYSIDLDCVVLPHLRQFDHAGDYYARLFHELVHSTGAPRRLNRCAESEGDYFEQSCFEELVAEFGAAFLCGFAGIRNPSTQDLHATYIQSWAEVFQGDSRILGRAASAARRAADYICGKIPV